MMRDILILGDSTSMTIGVEQKAYPFLLADQPLWPQGCQFINISQPGITAADAAAYFLRKAAAYKDIAAVVIYLGNCDANATELNKGRFTPLRQALHELRARLNMKTPKSRLYNKIMRYAWNDRFYNPALERPESPSDFKYNLCRIIDSCAKRHIPVVLMRPAAHHAFPAGIGKGNFIYYHYFNLTTSFAGRLTHPDPRFLEAYKKYEEADYEGSRKLYKEILEKPYEGLPSAEYRLLLVHNYAMASACLGKSAEADALFQLLLKEWNSRQEIVLFNYAMMLLKQGGQQGFSKYMDKAYAMDSSMYRIKKEYVDKIDQIAAQYSHVSVVSMEGIDDAMFIDHCHLLPLGQVQLQERVLDALRKLNVATGRSKAVITNDLCNLEQALGNDAGFHEYYKTFAPYSEEQIRMDVSRLQEDFQKNGDFTDASLAFITSDMLRAIEYYRKHPCFSTAADICRFPPQYPWDIGRFPEYFLVRQIIPFLKEIEKDAAREPLFPASSGLLRGTEALLSILPHQAKSSASLPLALNSVEDEAWLGRILARVERLLQEHLTLGPQCQERLLTTIFWYFRETLRWGSHSRYAMRYDRLTLEFAAEALAIAAWLDARSGNKRSTVIKNLADTLLEAIIVHERYAPQFLLNNLGFMEAYKIDLAKVLGKMSGFKMKAIHQ